MSQKDLKIKSDELFLKLLMEHQQNIYAYIMSLLHNSVHADDVMQETITVMWRRFSEFEPGSNFTAWGIRIARYKTYKFFNKSSNMTVQFNSELVESIDRCMTGKLNEMEERMSALKNCIGKLEEDDRDLVRMRYENKIATRKVAEVVGVSKHKMYRKMTKIHLLLQQCIRRALLREECE